MKVNFINRGLNSLIISLLIHMLFFSGVSIVWLGQVRHIEPPNMYIPSYAYHEDGAPQPEPVKTAEQANLPPTESTTPNSIPLARPKQATQPNQTSVTSQKSPASEPIHLLGDKKKVPKPIIKILGKAITAHLIYPKIALDFKVRGTAYVGFIIHPDGRLTNIQIVQTSRAGILDEQALSAVMGATPLKNISQYISEPKNMVIGIVFR